MEINIALKSMKSRNDWGFEKKNEWNLCIKVRFEIKQLFFFEISGGLWSREYLSPIPETDM